MSRQGGGAGGAVPTGDPTQALPAPVQLPRSNGELVFDAPWESRAFGMALVLHAAGAFEWAEFQQRLIHEVEQSSRSEAWRPYYACWVGALEVVITDKGLLAPGDVSAMVARVQVAEQDDHAPRPALG